MPSIRIPYLPLGYRQPDDPEVPYETVQCDFWDSEAYTPALVGATRGGKTVTGAGKNLKNILKYQCNGLAVAPRWDQARGILVEEYKKIIPPELVYPTSDGGVFHETQKVIRLLSLEALKEGKQEPGPIIYFKSGEDPWAIYGFNCGTAQLDEAPQMPEESFGASIERCSQAPSQLFGTFTPKGGPLNWAIKKWMLGRKVEVPGRVGLRFENLDPESPAWYMDYKANFTMSDRWRRMMEINLGLDTAYGRQELLAEVVDFGGVIYAGFNPKIHVQLRLDEFVRVGGGIDRALAGVTAVLLTGLDKNGRVHWFHEWGGERMDLEQVGLHCLGLQREYPALTFHADPRPGGEMELETLRRLGVRVQRADKKDMLDVGVKLIWQYLKVQGDNLPGLFIRPWLTNTIMQMQSWSFKEGHEGATTIVSDNVEKHNRDYIDAARFGMVGLMRSDRPRPIQIVWGSQHAQRRTGQKDYRRTLQQLGVR